MSDRNSLLISQDHWLRKTPIAHRGLHDGNKTIPENSLAAFDLAMAGNYAIELDLHLSSDNQPMVFHDENLSRMTGQPGKITQYPSQFLQTLKLSQTTQIIPTLQQVLQLVCGRVPILIELKESKEVGLLETAVTDLISDYSGEVAIQSFNPQRVYWFKTHQPKILRGQLSGDLEGEGLSLTRRILLKHLFLTPWNKPHFIGYQFTAQKPWLHAYCQQRHLPLLSWTIRNETDAIQALNSGSNIIFEGFQLPGQPHLNNRPKRGTNT